LISAGASPDPTGELRAESSPTHLAGGERALRLGFSGHVLQPFRPCCVDPQHPLKINPSYGLVQTDGHGHLLV